MLKWQIIRIFPTAWRGLLFSTVILPEDTEVRMKWLGLTGCRRSIWKTEILPAIMSGTAGSSRL